MLFLLVPTAAFAAPVPTMPPDQLQPGQKAVVKTVFQGDRIEEFEAEIVGVVKGGRTEGDLILARATSERVIRSGVAQGMSGSPVYVNGRLVGALSSGWSFSREPLFGITPIGEMLAVLDLPARPDTSGSAGPSGSDPRGASVSWAGLRWDDPPADPGEPALPGSPPPAWGAGPVPLAVPMSGGGLHPAALDVTRRLLAPFGFAVTPGGRDPRGGPPADSLQPGAAVAVDVLTGDLQLAAIGTLTWRDGDRVLAFGHPLFQAGDVRLPLSTAEIATIVASDLTSFKLGIRGRPVGTLEQDRRTAIAGRIGTPPSLLPLTVTVAGPSRPQQRFAFGTIEDRALAPQLAAIAALNSFLESGGAAGNQTLRWTQRLVRAGMPPLVLTDVLAGDAPQSELVAAIAAPLRFLYANPFAKLDLDSLAISIDVLPEKRTWFLRTARVLDAAARPGGVLRVECQVEPWRGERTVVAIEVSVPEEVPDGRYILYVGGGPELSRYEAARLPGRYRPTSLPDAWRRLAESRSSDGLYAALFASAPEVTREGRDYPELPVSALALLAGVQIAGDSGRRGDGARLDERRAPFPGPVRGELLLSVVVDARAPATGAPSR